MARRRYPEGAFETAAPDPFSVSNNLVGLTYPSPSTTFSTPSPAYPPVTAPPTSFPSPTSPPPSSQVAVSSVHSPFATGPTATAFSGPPLAEPSYHTLEAVSPFGATAPYHTDTNTPTISAPPVGPSPVQAIPSHPHGTPGRRYYPEVDAEGGGFSAEVDDTTQRMAAVSLQQQPSQTPFAQLQQLPPTTSTSRPLTQPGYGQGFQVPTAQAPHPIAPAEEPTIKPDSEAQCPPNWLRMTINAVPNTPALLQKVGIPFGCIIHPMAQSEEYKIPVVNFGRVGIMRCRKCRAYINPFVQFIEGGRRWKCNFCELVNDVPQDYFSELDRNGRRKDHGERPELSRGCVEFVAPSEYMVRRPMPPTYFFVVDVSYYAISSGMLKVFAETITDVLDKLPDRERTNIGFITFDSTIHFYNLKSSLSQPRMLVVSDIDDVFLPLPDDMLVNLKESRNVVDTLLTRLPTMHQHTQNVEAALGPALKAAWNVLRLVGGKMMLFLSKLPSLGFAALKPRDDSKLLGTDKEINLLKSENNFYKDFALDCSRQQISVDVFLFSPHYTDTATLSCLSQYTGGQTVYYPAFTAEKDGHKFRCDLTRILTRETGWEAVMRIRVSQGLKIQAHYGNFFIRSSDLMALPNIDADKAFGAQIQLKDPINSKYVSVQNALLYTTSLGERRIRVSTLCLPVTNSLSDLFKFADVDAIVSLTAKMAVEKALSTKLSDARQALLNKCVDILTVYRSSFASPQTSSTQLILPESLKLLPLYTLALIKNLAFRSGSEIRPDERAYHMSLLRTLPVSLSIAFLYPRLYQLNNMPPECGRVDGSGRVVLPAVNNLSSEKLDQAGIFLLDDGQYLLLWIARAASPDLLHQLFGTSHLSTADNQLELVDQGNDFSSRVCAIVSSLRAQHSSNQKLYIIREGDPLEYRFFAHFVEDRSKTLPSYYEFLCQLQRQVQSRMK
jgi:protein transport protein SEC24